MAVFLAVPLKRTSEVDLVKPLKSVFSSFCIAADKPIDYDDALNELTKLRMNSTWRTLDKHESSLDVMTRYYDQISFLDAKCPSIELPVEFTWKDAFERGNLFLQSPKLSMPTLAFERACILFNIGAMQSQVACSHANDVTNDEGLKLAAKYFQMASGTFQHVKTFTSVMEDATPDMHLETLSVVQALMLAQAQESFFFKATADKMKDTVIAKVAARAEELYAEVMKFMMKEHILTIWEKEWIKVITGKQAGFLGLAEYYQSLVCKTRKDFGEELARLQKALDVLKAADVKGTLPEAFRDYIPKIQNNYDGAKKDNDFIYHARIPDSKSLPTIDKAALAKPIPPGEKLNPNSHDMFGALLPMPVQQAMSAFDLRKTEIVNGEKAKLQSETQMLNAILASLNLPAALEDTAGNCLPPSLKEKAQAVKDRGGLESIQKLLNELPSLLQRNSEILKECERMLQDEEDCDSELRSKFLGNWIRTPSAKLNEPLKANLKKYKQIISTAMLADGIVKEKYDKHKDKLVMLCSSEEQLVSSIPSGRPVAGGSVTEQLKQLMREVNVLKAERESFISELECPTIDMKSKFLSALSNDGAVNEEALSVETLGEMYGPIQQRIRENISKQAKLIAEIQNANSEFSKQKSLDGSGAKRESMFSELAAAHDAYMELIGNLEEGSKFYNNLTEVLVNFQNKISDFCFARKTEKDELYKEMQRNIVSAATQPSPLQPPQTENKSKPVRPPPPKTEPSNIAPPNWNVPTSMQPSQPMPMAQQNMGHPEAQSQVPYPAYPSYPFPYPAGPYNPYGQIVVPPFPSAPGYQGQAQPYPYPANTGYPFPMPSQQQQQPPYPYPQQQYRPQ